MKKIKHITEVDVINPVDFFNRDYTEHAVDMLLKKIAPLERNGANHLTYIKNNSDRKKLMITITKEGNFLATMKNGLNMTIGEEYSPFMMIQKYVFRNSWTETVSYVKHSVMNNENEYCRIGTKYFQRFKKIDRYGVLRDTINPWERQAILDDHNKQFLGSIDKYSGWCIVPDNKNYKREHAGSYNNYAQFDHVAMDKADYVGEEQWKWINTLLKHIFGDDHYHLGLIYMKVLYLYPKQALPILALLSQERQTGKTTYVNLMSVLFGDNSIIINPQDIGNQFNSSYASKNVIMIEESHFESRQSMEKIKNLATQKEITVNMKHVTQYKIPFFGKLIITSNDESKFTKVDTDEIRYWVRKVPTLKGKENHEILEEMTKEIPAFLCFLENLHEVKGKHHKYLKSDGSVELTKYSRMVLDPAEITTEALDAVKLESREGIHKEIEMYLDNHCMQNVGIKTFYFIGIDIKEKFFSHNHRFGVDYINKVLKTNMNLDKLANQKKYLPLEDGVMGAQKRNGRPYIFENPYYNEDENNEDDPDVPF